MVPIGAILGAAQLGYGLYQQSRNKQPKYDIPDEFTKLGTTLAQTRDMPGYNDAVAGIMGRSASSISAIKEVAPPTNTAGAVVQTEANANKALASLGVSKAGFAENNRMRYAQYLREMGGQKLAKQNFENNQAELQRMATSELIGGGINNVNNWYEGYMKNQLNEDFYNKLLGSLADETTGSSGNSSSGQGYNPGDWTKKWGLAFKPKPSMDFRLAFSR